MKTEFKGVDTPAMLRRSQFARLHDVGEKAVKRKGIDPFNVRKFQMSKLKTLLKGKAKTPAMIGLLGGISAVRKNKQNREEYKKLLSEVRRQNARR